MTNENGTTKGFIFGLLAGSAIGAILALLYAPKSGKELRADIKTKTDELLANAEEVLDEARTKAGSVVVDAKRRSEQVISDVKSQADTLLHDADKVLNNAKQRSSTLFEEGVKVKDAMKAGMDAYKQERNKS